MLLGCNSIGFSFRRLFGGELTIVCLGKAGGDDKIRGMGMLQIVMIVVAVVILGSAVAMKMSRKS
jgi:hypothetical protein